MATSGTVPTDRRSRADWVAVAQELAPAFAARAAGHDTDDTFVSDNYADLRRRRVFSAAVPAELGGDSGLAVASRACAGRRSPAPTRRRRADPGHERRLRLADRLRPGREGGGRLSRHGAEDLRQWLPSGRPP